MTAVEWLIEQICGEHTGQWTKEIELAKEMEKEQIIDSVFFGIHMKYNKIDSPIERAEQYYNETFSNKGD